MGDPGQRREVKGGGAHRAESRPATHAELAAMWQAVSEAQGALGRHRRYFRATPADVRLTEQLSLLPLLHDWIPIFAHEIDMLRYLLVRYADAVERAASDDAAHGVITAIRLMAADRARIGPPVVSERHLPELVTPPGAAI